jgi:hypothetical protein
MNIRRSFFRTKNDIKAFLRDHDAPFVAKVYRASPKELSANSGACGRIEIWYPRRASLSALRPFQLPHDFALPRIAKTSRHATFAR